jgi:hypothetical protein
MRNDDPFPLPLLMTFPVSFERAENLRGERCSQWTTRLAHAGAFAGVTVVSRKSLNGIARATARRDTRRAHAAVVSVWDYWLTEIQQGLVSIREQERDSMPRPAASINSLRRYLLGTVLGVAVAGEISAADTLGKVSVTIEAGNASDTLAELIRQTGLQILFEADAVRGHLTRAVSGQLDAAEVLRLMLEDSGLIFEVINERTIAVRPATAPEPTRHEAMVLR